MKPVSPSQRVTTNDTPNGFEIVISARRSVLITLIYGLLIIIWGVVEYILITVYFSYFIGENSSDSKTALLFSLAACTLFGAFGIYGWLYNIAGIERIVIKYRTLSIKQDLLGLGITWRYDLNHVSDIRIGIKQRFFSELFYFYDSSIIFDYKGDTYQFGSSIDEIEAQFIVNELQKHHGISGAV